MSIRSIVLLCLLLIVVRPCVAAESSPGYDEMIRTDVLVVGATPCGISAAIAAARCGSNVILTDMNGHIGGMMSSGLGRTDIGPRNTVGGIFREFVGSVKKHYADTYGADSQQVKDSSDGYYFEPSVAEQTFDCMVKAEKRIKLRLRYRPESVLVYGHRVHGVTFLDTKTGRRIQIRGAVTIDATYEGDIAATAGVPYRVGRESREEFGEPIAGTLYMDHYTRMVLPGTSGDGDDRVQAYNFRLCLTRNSENRVLPKKPDCYNRDDYLRVLTSIRDGRLKTIKDILDYRSVPNGKSDTNNTPKSLISTDLPEENYRYPEASYEEREKIVKRHVDYTLGLLYFLQNDPEMPEDVKSQFRELGFAKDEYTDNDNFPRQIYVREARRIHGIYTFTYHDAVYAPGLLRAPVHWESIACGGYAMDSHATRKYEPSHEVMEGFYYLGGITRSYQIPYGIMVPQKVDALLVPCAVSATHIGFGTLRMEPVWMALGQAAGTAAHLARNLYVEPRDVPVNRVQSLLAQNGQVLTAFMDAQWPTAAVPDSAWQALQFWGTRGFFDANSAKPLETITRGTAAQWLMCAIRQGDFMTYYGPDMSHLGGGAPESSLAQLADSQIVSTVGDPNAVLTEGEMAFWLSRIEPWLDGAIGDTWAKRAKPKDSPTEIAQPANPDAPVTRARFCETLYAKYRSATPAGIH